MHGLHYALEHVARGDPLLVGEAPSAHGDPTKPLTGNVGRRLAHAAGLGFPAPFLRCFGRVNLLQEFPGYADGKGGGATFPPDEARAAARTLVFELMRDAEVRARRPPRPHLILLGRRVAAAFDCDKFGEAWFIRQAVQLTVLGSLEESLGGSQFDATVVPHPSQLSRWWNDPANLARAQAFFLSLRAGPARDAPV